MSSSSGLRDLESEFGCVLSDAASDSSLLRELATAYEKVGTVQGNAFGANLGDVPGALDSYRKALAIRELLAKTNLDNIDDQVALAQSQRLFAATFANNRAQVRDDNVNVGNELRALATAERAHQLAPSNAAVLRELESNYDLMAHSASLRASILSLLCKRLTNTPVRQAGSLLKCPDDRKN